MCFKLVMLLKKDGGVVCVAQGASLSQVFVHKQFFSYAKPACVFAHRVAPTVRILSISS